MCRLRGKRVGFHLTSLKFKQQNYRSLLRFYFHIVLEQLKTNFQSRSLCKTAERPDVKTNFQSYGWAPAWRLHTKLYKFGENISSDISYTNYSFDPNLGEGLCIFTSFHFPDSGLYLSNGFDFYFDLFWMAWHWKPEKRQGCSSSPMQSLHAKSFWIYRAAKPGMTIHRINSLWASSPIWASKASRATRVPLARLLPSGGLARRLPDKKKERTK